MSFNFRCSMRPGAGRGLSTGGTGNGKKTRLPKGDIEETMSSYKKVRDLERENDEACADARSWRNLVGDGSVGSAGDVDVVAGKCLPAPRERPYMTYAEFPPLSDF